MKKMKKILAMLLALTMVLGMSLTAMAYDAVSIPVVGGEKATFAKLQLIEVDTKTDTGWKFCTDAIAKDYTDAFGITTGDAIPTEKQKQKAIWMLIGNQDYKDDLDGDGVFEEVEIELPAGVAKAEDSQIAIALANVKGGHTFTGHVELVNLKVDEAGVYYIDGIETGFVYGSMAAYVSFVYNENKVPASLTCVGVVAKKVPTSIVKDAELLDVKDEVTEINRVEKYSVTSTVPYIPTTDSDRKYIVKDYLQGGEYVVNTNNKVDVTVVIGDSADPLYSEVHEASVKEAIVGTAFELDLSTLIDDDNTYANKNIVLTYEAKVKDVHVHNDVEMGTATNASKFGKSNEDLYTGQITLTKYAEDQTKTTLEDNKKLANAEFKVYKKVVEEGNEVIKWAKFDANYKFDTWVDSETDAVAVKTSADGTLTIQGLDLGTYYFKEVVAPTGYSINETDVSATIVLEGSEAVGTLYAATHMLDTQLNALPSTGGIGTTIFTVAGCGIMIAAAYFFFASRKKENE